MSSGGGSGEARSTDNKDVQPRSKCGRAVFGRDACAVNAGLQGSSFIDDHRSGRA